MGSCSFALASPTSSWKHNSLSADQAKKQRTQGSRWPIIMEPLFHLLTLLILPYDSQARAEYPVTLPGGAWAWGRVGDQPKPVTATAAPRAAAAATTAAAAAAPRATTAAAEAEVETIFAVSGDSASAEP